MTTLSNSRYRVAFVGGGNMAAALIGGMLGEVASPRDILVIEHNEQTARDLATRFGVITRVAPVSHTAELLAMVDAIVLAVKPQQLRAIATELGPLLTSQLVISIAAGVRMADLSRWLGDYQKLVRCMPNTPALIGKGVTGMAASAGVNADRRQMADAILGSVGSTVWFDDESRLDVVTGISGSGPAYVFYFMEAMVEAATQLGMTAEQARSLTLQTFIGAAELAQSSEEPLGVLRERVTSRGGTTYAALESMRQSAVAPAIGEAVSAAVDRAREMGDELSR